MSDAENRSYSLPSSGSGALEGPCSSLRAGQGCSLALISARAACWSRPLGEAATWRRLAGKGLVSCVRRRQLLTQLWSVPEVEEGGGQELWASRGRGCIMDHLWAPFWPGVGSLCLLLAVAAWAPPPNRPGPEFESKGKDGAVCGPPALGLGGQCWGLNFSLVSWGPSWCLNS